MSLDGIEIIVNGSGSHHELRKLHQRVDLIQAATSKVWGSALMLLQSPHTMHMGHYDFIQEHM